MKHGINFLMAIVLCTIFTTFSSCNKEKAETAQGSLKFSFQMGTSLKSLALTDTVISGDTAETSFSVLITLTDQNGQEVFSNKKLEIYSFGGTYLSESLSLETGTYQLTGFVVIRNNAVVYAAPKAGSDRAQLVDLPLPITMVIQKDMATMVEPEVLAATDDAASDFGYTGFGFDVVPTSIFKIITYDGNGIDSANTVSSELYVTLIAGTDTTVVGDSAGNYSYKTLHYKLNSGTNSIEVNTATYYALSIYKSGYYSWTGYYSQADLQNYKNTPLQVWLQKISYPNPTDSTLTK